ncbi:MFS transporter [Oenococcus oeni]|uniref:MFS transporter n=1 Tax=Oenococcus oeni TaxID=1247 RepID=UPI00050F1052|nr:MFS transporter [Oenococcus oeni]KGH55532.1 major facilitator transporter [Oenococcus oeni S22]OIK61752.1 MFS transporter [Oenococcus oeni]OIM65764.1 MFS transporter [Oenococcus oeni]
MQEENIVHRPLFKLSILSISLMTMIAPAISSALPLMYGSFKGETETAVETLVTVPNFGIIVFLFLSPFVIKLIGGKNTVIFGLLLALVAGIIPVFSNDYALVFVSRFLLGSGIGLFNSMCVSLIARFYKGDELSTMMGFQGATGSLGGALGAFLVNWLVTLGWHQTFLIYLIALPIMALFIFCIPRQLLNEGKSVSSSGKQVSSNSGKQTINLPVWGLSVLIFLVFAFFLASQLQLPALVTAKKIGSLSQVSVLNGITTLFGIPIGAVYGKVSKFLKNLTLSAGFLFAALGFSLIAFGSDLLIVGLGAIVSGVGFGLMVPSIYVWMAKVAPKNSENLASTVLLVTTNIGVFACPTILNFLGGLFWTAGAQSSMLVAMIAFIVMFVISIFSIFSFKTRNKKEIV